MSKTQSVLLALCVVLASASAAIADAPLTIVCRGGGTMNFHYDLSITPSATGPTATLGSPTVMVLFNKLTEFEAAADGSNLPAGACGFVERNMTETDPSRFTDGKAEPLRIEFFSSNSSTVPTSFTVHSSWSTTTLHDQTKIYSAKVVNAGTFWQIQ